MNSNAVLGGVVATCLVAGIVGYGLLTRGTDVIAVTANAPGDTSVQTQEAPDEAASVPAVPPAEVPVQPAAAEIAAAAPEAQTTPEMPRAPEALLPEMGLVRVDAQGGALVAGTGSALAEVTVRLDGVAIASARTDRSGGFVTMFDLPLSVEPQLLTLEMETADGGVARAAESVIVAPARPEPARPGALPVAERDTARPAQEQEVAQQAEIPQAGPEPRVETAQGTDPALATPSDLPSVAAGNTFAARTEPADPVELASVAQTGTAPLPGTAPSDTPRAGNDRTASERATPPAPATPERTVAPEPTARPETATEIAAASPVPGGDAPEIAAREASPPEAPAAAPRLIRTGPQGLSVIPPTTAAQPEVTQALGIEVIAYDAVGDVQLAGRAQTDAELRIYLNNQAVQTVRVGPDGKWSAPLNEVASGVYTLRIDEVDAQGAVTARVETPFQRTAPEIAAQARRDGATAITVQTGFTLWALSEGYFGDGVQYVQLFEANRDQIRDPDLIYPGQVFRLPEVE
ncbi:LysM peptidoglycan-binding domain-containing protein [Jannaschia seohaensis]|uniref:Nucleoid-associated protein YgaU n=1 Tax=Jannaschia seohaensis TaxID=475081 RepID=A0A2Y9B0B4_9RHOB|nr:LysM peptidoglycan-binding domain-containing protein [Jannaschia seohaensis]PWJ15851.1 nucleoid-associated protein YgaU [Jannaschia seohaensis]SSA49555.1 Nucleoid-associated protein YgaU, contains BON and LysM domains [Jannaschia seohaensis]